MTNKKCMFDLTRDEIAEQVLLTTSPAFYSGPIKSNEEVYEWLHKYGFINYTKPGYTILRDFKITYENGITIIYETNQFETGLVYCPYIPIEFIELDLVIKPSKKAVP